MGVRFVCFLLPSKEATTAKPPPDRMLGYISGVVHTALPEDGKTWPDEYIDLTLLINCEIVLIIP